MNETVATLPDIEVSVKYPNMPPAILLNAAIISVSQIILDSLLETKKAVMAGAVKKLMTSIEPTVSKAVTAVIETSDIRM